LLCGCCWFVDDVCCVVIFVIIHLFIIIDFMVVAVRTIDAAGIMKIMDRGRSLYFPRQSTNMSHRPRPNSFYSRTNEIFGDGVL
jgi:hypothetical protein